MFSDRVQPLGRKSDHNELAKSDYFPAEKSRRRWVKEKHHHDDRTMSHPVRARNPRRPARPLKNLSDIEYPNFPNHRPGRQKNLTSMLERNILLGVLPNNSDATEGTIASSC
jgi:hypothetical protein